MHSNSSNPLFSCFSLLVGKLRFWSIKTLFRKHRSYVEVTGVLASPSNFIINRLASFQSVSRTLEDTRLGKGIWRAELSIKGKARLGMPVVLGIEMVEPSIPPIIGPSSVRGCFGELEGVEVSCTRPSEPPEPVALSLPDTFTPFTFFHLAQIVAASKRAAFCLLAILSSIFSG